MPPGVPSPLGICAVWFILVGIWILISTKMGIWDMKAESTSFWAIGNYKDTWLLLFMVYCSFVWGVLVPLQNWPFRLVRMPWGGILASAFATVVSILVTLFLLSLVGPVFDDIYEAMTYGYMGVSWSFFITLFFGVGSEKPYLWAGQQTNAIYKWESGFGPDLVVLDVMMPGLNGFEVCREIRKKHPAAELPVIMLTARNQVSDLVEGFDSGANDHLTKPFNKQEFLSRVKTLLELKRTTEKLSEALSQLEEHNRILEKGMREKTHHLETASRQLMVSEDRYRTIFENTGTAHYRRGLQYTPGQQWEKLFSYSREDTEGRGWEEFIQEDEVEKVKAYCRMRRDNPASVSKTYEYLGKDKSGEVRDILLTVSMIPGSGRIIASLNDITERKRAERLIRHMAYHDSLTGLPNRKLFQDRLSQELSRASRKKEMFAVMFLDLDDYKSVNDT